MQKLSKFAALVLAIIVVIGIGSTASVQAVAVQGTVDNVAVTCQNGTASIVMTGDIPGGNVEMNYSFTQDGTTVSRHVCSVNYAAGVASWDVTLPAGGTWDYSIDVGTFGGDVAAASFSGTCGAAPAPAQAPDFSYPDRLNARDVAAPVAIFPVSYESGVGLDFYAIGADNEGTLALVVTPEQIAAVPAVPTANTVIAATADGSITLYRLATGEFQVVMGDYSVIFSDLMVDAAVTH